jgi:hypothetical protein
MTADNLVSFEKQEGPRKIWEIAQEIKRDWKNPYFGAVPYLTAMLTLSNPEDHYGFVDADSIVRYFLSNANTYRGDTARRVKAELRKLVGI